MVVDATVVGRLSVTTLQAFRELDQELRDQRIELWVASLPPRALAQARLAPGWAEMDDAGRLHPDVPAALVAFKSRA